MARKRHSVSTANVIPVSALTKRSGNGYKIDQPAFADAKRVLTEYLKGVADPESPYFRQLNLTGAARAVRESWPNIGSAYSLCRSMREHPDLRPLYEAASAAVA